MNKPLLTTTLILLAVLLAGACHGQVEWVTNTNDAGAGSLRAAVANVPDDGAVLFNSGVFSSAQTIVLTSGEISSTLKSYRIVGPGADMLTISGNNASRVFNFVGPVAGLVDIIELMGLTIADGRADGGGGILATGTGLQLTECRITNCDATNGGASATGRGGGVHIDLTPPPGYWDTLLKRCCFDNNVAVNGGGIAITGNSTLNSGAFIQASTVSGNMATGTGSDGGGGIFIDGPGSGTTLIYVQMCTIYQNSAPAGSGGGILGLGGTLDLRIVFSILAGNGAATGPDGLCTTSIDLLDSVSLVGEDTGGPYTGTWGSLIGTAAAPMDPMLGPLQDNGGPTPTHALLPGSPAIDGYPVVATLFALLWDQRGYQRGALSDIGAYEFGASASGGGGPQGPAGPTGADGQDGEDGGGCMAGVGGSAALLLLLLPLLARRRRLRGPPPGNNGILRRGEFGD